MVIPNLVFKYTLSHDASGIPTTKVKLWTFMFAVGICIATIIISISGIGIVAIPTGIIAGGFSQSISNKK